MPTQLRLLAALLACLPAFASDHLDTAAVVADPAADIGDLYAWTSPDGRKLNLVMTIVGKQFSDHVRYGFHIDSGRELGATRASISVLCEFNSANAGECRLGDIDRARGDFASEAGHAAERGTFRVFAGLRDDPFFNNVRGTRAALNVAGAAMDTGVARDGGGCPRLDAATVAKLRDEWRHTAGGPATSLLAGWKTAALVVEVDLAAVNRGGKLLGVWASTVVRGVTPGHARVLDDGVAIDRMGRALTGNGLLATFGTAAESEALKARYNRAGRDEWPSFVPDLAVNLANYDGFDGICGNQWLAVANSPPPTRYDGLARLLADDRLWLDSAARECTQYLAVEFAHVGAVNGDCGGRAPGYDAVEVFRSLLVGGGITGITDGVDHDDAAHPRDFPFLSP